MPEAAAPPQDPAAQVPPRQLLSLLALAAMVGLVVSLAAWCFLEAVHWTQVWVYDDLPDALGYDGDAPTWWPLPVCFVAAVIVAFAIVRMPGRGGHVPALGLNASPTDPRDLPGVMVAAVAGIGLGLVLGPEAPLLALGGGLGILALRLVRQDAPAQVTSVIAASGSLAALSFIFDSPLIAAVVIIEAAAIGGPQMTMLLLPGLLAAGIGSLVSLGLGSWTGLSTSDYALETLTVPDFARPDIVDFMWTIPFAVAIAIAVYVIRRIALALLPRVEGREFQLLPVAGLAVAGLAIAFSELKDKPVDMVLFSGESALPTLVSGADTWTVAALLLLILFKGLAWGISLASFRGGPIFPSLFLGGAAGLAASHLAGFAETAAVAVGMGAAVAAILQLPLSAVIMAAIVLTILLPEGTRTLPRWLLPIIESILLIAVIAGDPGKIDRRASRWRWLSIVLVSVLVVSALVATGQLIELLINGGKETDSASELLAAGAIVWTANNIAFALLFWELDAGGAASRAHRVRAYPDFAFPQQVNPDLAPPGWQPRFIDYLYLGFTNGTAFSPTDAMPLAPWAKVAMAVQATASLAILGLVIARAVNVFT